MYWPGSLARSSRLLVVLYVSSRLKLEILIVFYGQNSVWKWIPWVYNVGYNGKILVTQIPGSQAVTVSKLVGGLHCRAIPPHS